MDKNTFTGLFLILCILVASFFLLQPSEEAIKEEQKRLQWNTMERIDSSRFSHDIIQRNASKPIVGLNQRFGQDASDSEQLVTLENKDVRIKISSIGGCVQMVALKNFATFDKKPLILFEGKENQLGLNFTANGQTVLTNHLHFEPISHHSKAATLRFTYAEKQHIDYIYSLEDKGYKLGFKIVIHGLNDLIGNQNKCLLNWTANLRQQEKDVHIERQHATIYFQLANDEVDHLDEMQDDNEQVDKKNIRWISFKQHFFSSALIAKEGFTQANLSVRTNSYAHYLKQMQAHVQLPYKEGAIKNYSMEFYFGPNRFSVLQQQGYGLEKQINLGWGPLKYINRFAVLPVFNFLKAFNCGVGLIIFLLTLLLKLLLFPLTYKSYVSMAKMRILKPEMDAVKEKVGEDNPALLQQEYLKLYRQAGVNPLGGCLPILIQMPILIAFFNFFPSLFELRGESFLWIRDLSTYDSFIDLSFGLPFIGKHISLMCLLMTVSTIIYTYFNNQISGVSGQMKYIGYITPLLFFGILNTYPAGLNYYYLCANILTFTQQFIIHQLIDDEKIHAKIQEHKKKPEQAKKQSEFQKRLEAYMRQKQITPKAKR